MEHRTLGATGEQVSILGFGAAPLGNEYGDVDDGEGARAVNRAIDLGITFFDTAPYYGRTLSEERLGRALEGRRYEVFLATKCARFDKAGFDFSAARVHSSIDESLARLRTDRVDLLQIHDVEFGDRSQVLHETLPAVMEVKAAGKARFVGITGLAVPMLRDLAAEFPVDTILSYCHYDLLATDFADLVFPLAAERGIGLINASPLHMGVLAPVGPQGWHPAPEEVKEAGRRIVALCDERGVDPVHVALRFSLDQPALATTLCGMRTVAEVEHDAAALDSASDPALLEEIAAIAAPVKDWTWHEGRPENAPPLRPGA